MKQLRMIINGWLGKLEAWWREVPIKKQHRYARCFFGGYLILTIAVLVEVWHETKTADFVPVTRHIENPVLPKKKPGAPTRDSISIILKKKMYGK